MSYFALPALVAILAGLGSPPAQAQPTPRPDPNPKGTLVGPDPAPGAASPAPTRRTSTPLAQPHAVTTTFAAPARPAPPKPKAAEPSGRARPAHAASVERQAARALRVLFPFPAATEAALGVAGDRSTRPLLLSALALMVLVLTSASLLALTARATRRVRR